MFVTRAEAPTGVRVSAMKALGMGRMAAVVTSPMVNTGDGGLSPVFLGFCLVLRRCGNDLLLTTSDAYTTGNEKPLLSSRQRGTLQ